MYRSVIMAAALLAAGCSSDANVKPSPEPDPQAPRCPGYVADTVFGSSGTDYANAVAINEDGTRVLAAGFVEHPTDFGGGVHGTDDDVRDGYVVVRDGQLGWLFDHVVSGAGDIDIIDAAFTPDGGVVAVGDFRESIDLDTTYLSAGGADLFVMKLDDAGALAWARVFGGAGGDFARGVKVHAASGQVVVGGTFAQQLDVDGTVLGGGAMDSVFVMTLDANGDVAWTKTSSGAGRIRASALAMDGSGAVTLATLFSESVEVGGVSYPAEGYEDGLLWSLDAAGTTRWSYAVTGPELEGFWRVAMAPNGDVYATLDTGNEAVIAPGETRSEGDKVLALSGAGVYRWDAPLAASEHMVAWALGVTDTQVLAGGVSVGALEVTDEPVAGLGSNDGFLAAFRQAGDIDYACLVGAVGPEEVSAIALHGDLIAITGAFEGATDFGGGTRMGFGGRDVFTALLRQPKVQ